ncbi:MAG: NUDIX hydrolase [Aestuariibaculum sp.]
MDEYIDIVDKLGIPTGKTALKSEIHQKGFYHNTVHLWLYTNNKHILLSQRSAKKIICPLMWDVSVAGHIDAGEMVEQAIIRETQEEIGLNINIEALYKIGVFECFQTYGNGIIDNEFHHTFIAKLDTPLTDLVIQKDEVEALKLVSFSEFQSLIDTIGSTNHFVPSNKTYYAFVLESIKKGVQN